MVRCDAALAWYRPPVDAILLFSHGSVLCGAEQSLLSLARMMESRGDAPVVEAGFLNYASPDFESAVSTCVNRGATRITIAPYFLVAGKFVRQDLPPRITRAKEQHPEVEFRTADAMRDHAALADAILGAASAASEPSRHRDTLEQAERFCRRSPDCPNYGTPACPATEPTI